MSSFPVMYFLDECCESHVRPNKVYQQKRASGITTPSPVGYALPAKLLYCKIAS